MNDKTGRMRISLHFFREKKLSIQKSSEKLCTTSNRHEHVGLTTSGIGIVLLTEHKRGKIKGRAAKTKNRHLKKTSNGS
jgi:hypothetical protein